LIAPEGTVHVYVYVLAPEGTAVIVAGDVSHTVTLETLTVGGVGSTNTIVVVLGILHPLMFKLKLEYDPAVKPVITI
jgi:hypothetical protein